MSAGQPAVTITGDLLLSAAGTNCFLRFEWMRLLLISEAALLPVGELRRFDGWSSAGRGKDEEDHDGQGRDFHGNHQAEHSANRERLAVPGHPCRIRSPGRHSE